VFYELSEVHPHQAEMHFLQQNTNSTTNLIFYTLISIGGTGGKIKTKVGKNKFAYQLGLKCFNALY
jgi:hypothetical protein